MSLRNVYALVVAGGIGLLATAASAAVVNVNLNPTGSKALNGTAWDVNVAPLAYTGNTWTDAAGAGATDMLDSTGAATTIDFALTNTQYFADGWGGLKMLQGGYYNNFGGTAKTMTLTLTGLDDSKQYDLYVAAAAAGTLGGTVTVGSTTLVSSGTSSAAWTAGTNYVHFSNLTSVGGQLVATIAPAGDCSIINGFQIATAVPEPATLALVGLASLGTLRRRRTA